MSRKKQFFYFFLIIFSLLVPFTSILLLENPNTLPIYDSINGIFINNEVPHTSNDWAPSGYKYRRDITIYPATPEADYKLN